jgi:5'-nucleotidase/UDP-sugar diphosphatase
MEGKMRSKGKSFGFKLFGFGAAILAAAGFSMFFPEQGFAAEGSKAPDKEIVILHTNDVHCGVDDNIGYAGLALYKKEMQAETDYVLLVDAGDAIQGAPIGTLSDGGYITDIMNKLGYDFAVPGNHEFDYGMDRLLELDKVLNCGYSSCNLVSLETGAPVFEPYRIFSFGDTDVALVGVCTPESFTKSTPAYFQDGNGNYIYGFCEDDSGEKLYDAVQSAVDSARGAGADYVIAVGHLGNEGITDRWSSESVIKNTSGLDAFIDGHSHENYTRQVINEKGEAVALTQTGTKLTDIGKLTIGTDGTISTELVKEVPEGTDINMSYTVKKGDTLSRIAKRELGSYDLWNNIYQANRNVLFSPDLLPVGAVITVPKGGSLNVDGKYVDADADSFIKGIQAQYNESLKTVLGSSAVELAVNDPDTGERAVRRAETNLGDLCADAFRYQLGADIGLMNGGGIRDSIKPGNITYNDTLRVFPFGNMVCMVEATGQQIKNALEMGVKNLPEESGGFLHVSGLSYTVDTSKPSSVVLDDKRNFVSVGGDYRVTDIMVGGQPLDTEKTYTVASHNYMLKSGGDGMSMFVGSKVLKDDIATDVDALSAYIRENLGGNVGEEYAALKGQGRITVK